MSANTAYEKDPDWQPPEELRAEVRERMIELQKKYESQYGKVLNKKL